MIATDSWFDIDRKGYADFIALKTLNPQLKTTIAIGGWDDSHDETDRFLSIPLWNFFNFTNLMDWTSTGNIRTVIPTRQDLLNC